MLRDGAPLPWMSGTSANGNGMVGTMPDHSMTLVRDSDQPCPVASLQPVEVAPAGDPVGFVAVAGGEQVVGLGVGGVAVDLAGVVEQVVVRRQLALLVHGRGPVVQICRAADEVARRDDGVGVERGQKQFPIEAVHAAAEPRQAVKDVLPVQ